MKSYHVDDFIQAALIEDIREGDHTTLACIPEEASGSAVLLIKQAGILAGIRMAERVFHLFDPTLAVKVMIPDGSHIQVGDQALRVTGSQRSILQTERLVLNILQRMSGIATRTAEYVDQIKGTEARILDTRKTTPNFRLFEKEAVRIGGGLNHRHGLYDMILIKDNHIDFAGGIPQAIERTTNYLKSKQLNLMIEIEARNLEEVGQILTTGQVHRILLDNFTPEQTRQAVEIIDGRVETESSGGITLKNIRDYALTGVNYISIGALTHQVKSLDMSLKAE